MGFQAPILTHFGNPKQTNCLKSELENSKTKIHLAGLIGSSFAILASAAVRNCANPNIFIFRDKEEASYFINDIEALLNNDVFFFPASYRRAYKINEDNNINILLRAEVLHKLNQKRNI